MQKNAESVLEVSELQTSIKNALIEKCQLLRIDEVSAITTLAKSSINLWVAQGKFIPPIVLSPTVKVWKLEDIACWVESKREAK